ncbi:hypothetical protein PTTG_30358, partial [Puccinia triticina 1-1 BBBD Race 1]
RTTAPDDLLPITDPDAIIRATNAEKRRQKQLEPSIHSESTPDDSITGSSSSSSSTVRPSTHPFSSQPPQPCSSTKQQQPNNTPLMAQSQQDQGGNHPPDYMKMLINAQLASVEQARKDRYAAREEREANAARMARMEEATLALIQSVRQTPPATAPTPRSAESELPRIRTSDGTRSTGPAQAIEPFLKWIHGVQVFFATKAIESDVNKIRVVGSFIDETNLLSVYANKVDSYVGKTWLEFKNRLFEVAITPEWREELYEQIVKLKCSTRRTSWATASPPHLDPTALGDLELARLVMFGMPDELKAMVKNFKLLKATPFKCADFEMSTNGYFQSLPRRQAFCPRAAIPSVNQAAPGSTNETVWRVHSFLDSQGRCHFCKKRCGSAPGACTNPIDQTFIEIPNSFVAPPKPADYRRPAALGPLGPTPGRATQPPASRPGPRAASVAAASEVEGGDDHPSNLFPDNLGLDKGQVSALAEIREEELL